MREGERQRVREISRQRVRKRERHVFCKDNDSSEYEREQVSERTSVSKRLGGGVGDRDRALDGNDDTVRTT